MSAPEQTLPEITTAQAAMLMSKSAGGVLPRYNGEWYLLKRNTKFSDFGGKRQGTENLMETALREFNEESGLTVDDITDVHGVFCGRYYGVLLVEVDKEPIAMEPGSIVVRMEAYETTNVHGRLFIKNLEYTMRDVEAAENAIAAPPAHHGFIFD
jgi:hypothetical protein